MALIKGSQTNSNLNPGASTQTLVHTHSGGTDSLLLVMMGMANTVNYSGMTYNGVTMTEIRQDPSSVFSSRYAAFYILNPPVGSHNIVVTFTGAQWSPTAIFAISYSGASGIGDNGFNDGITTPHNRNLTINAGSMISAMGNSFNTQSFGYIIDGVTQTNVGSGFNINNQIQAAHSDAIATAGSKVVTTRVDFGDITNFRVEIQEAGAPIPTRRRMWVI